MYLYEINTWRRFSRHGVLHRDETKNNLLLVARWMRQGFVKKVFRKGEVFYELTEKALPLLDEVRNLLRHQAHLCSKLSPRSQFYKALLGDIRFLDDSKIESSDFLFLGDWRLVPPPNRYQLELSQLRYYQARRSS